MKTLKSTNESEDISREAFDRERGPAAGARIDPPDAAPKTRRPSHRWLIGSGMLVAIVAGLAFGASQLGAERRAAATTNAAQENFIPTVRVATVHASDSTMTVSLPATTLAFEAANIYARANGYIEKRQVDIGDHVKDGTCWRRSPPPNSITRSRKMKRRCGKIRRICSKRSLAEISQTSQITATAIWSKKAGSRLNRVTQTGSPCRPRKLRSQLPNRTLQLSKP